MNYRWVIAASLATLISSTVLAADTADEKAIRDVIDAFVSATGRRDPQAVADLYTKDAIHFKKDGRSAFGRDAVVRLLLGSPASATPATPPSPKPTRVIVTDGVSTEGRMGYVYGRVCGSKADESTCLTRWFLVTRKGEDGRWRIEVDMDAPNLPAP